MAAARELALKALYSVDVRGAFASLALEDVFRHHPADRRERALATELTYGACRRLNTLDFRLGRASRRALSQLDPWTRNNLRLAAYQLFYLDRVPHAAAVHEAVELAKRFGGGGAPGFVNGVLRQLLRTRDEAAFPDPAADPVGYLSLAESMPAWLVRRWLDRYGYEATGALLACMNVPAPTVIRANRLRITPGDLAERLRAEGVVCRPGRCVPEALVIKGYPALEELAAFREGLFQVQDESSMLAAHALNPAPRQLLLDVAAAPGGKTTHLAELMGNTGRIVANDPQTRRLRLIRENCRRLGITCVETREGDGRTLPEAFEGKAAGVLLDAPCSGLGVLHRRPDARWRKSEEDIARLSRLQGELIEAAARCVAPGGTLVYSTCTTEPEENSQVVEGFLARHPAFAPDDLAPHLPPALQAEAGWQLQLLPQVHGTDGFFVARMKRRP